jgi:hypothetical protein
MAAYPGVRRRRRRRGGFWAVQQVHLSAAGHEAVQRRLASRSAAVSNYVAFRLQVLYSYCRLRPLISGAMPPAHAV